MTAHDTPNADPLDAAQVAERLRRYERDIDKSFGPPETIPYPMAYEFGEWADAIAALSQQLSEARAELKNRWQRMDSAPRDGTRILLAWEPYSGISEHVELGKWKSQNGWCNTYGKPFSGEPDAWAALAPFSLSPEAAEAKLATIAKPTWAGEFVLVPKQATPEMLGVWYRYKNGHRFAGEPPATDTSDVGAYKAMIEAAPVPTTALSKRDAPQAQVDIAALKRRLDYRLNDYLCEMKPDYDDSITGFNEAWSIVNKAFAEALTRPSTTEAKP